jgi:hypothetical protein
MNEANPDHPNAECGNCIRFQNNPAVLEKTFPGLTCLSSGFGSARAQDGLCDQHDLYLSAWDSCLDYAARPRSKHKFARPSLTP